MSDSEHASLELDGQPFEVLALTGEEGLSRLFRFEVLCAMDGAAPLDAQKLVGRAAVISLRDGLGASRTVHGIVSEATARTRRGGGDELRVVIRPAAFQLTIKRGCRVFQNQTVVEIAQALLADVQAPVRVAVVRQCPVREYTAQYREDDWTFLCRLLEDEGIYVWFDHAADETTLVLDDMSTAAPDLDGGADIGFAYERGMVARRELVLELASEIRATSTRFSVASFDPERPALELAASEGEGPLEDYDAPGAGPRDPADCGRVARIRREEALAARDGVAGLSSSVRLVPGRVARVHDHPVARYDARYLVTEVVTSVAQRRRNAIEPERAYACRFRAIRAGTPYRPRRVTPPARQAGLQSGVVVGAPSQEIHPDAQGRVRVQHHWDREGQRDARAGKWMRVAQRGTADSMLLPRVGWTVFTFNEEGSIDAPAVLSRIHDGEHLPAYSLPANKTRVVYRTATSPGGGSFNEVRFEDAVGAQELFMNASRDMNVLVQNEKRETIGRDSTRVVAVDHDMAVTANHAEAVSNDQRVAIAGDESLRVVGDRTRLVSGNETEVVGANRSIKTGTAHTSVVRGARRLDVGTALVDTTLGPIVSSSGASTAVVVGGAAVRVSAKSISEATDSTSVQTIGGAKLELAKGARFVSTKLAHVETVGGAMILKTAGQFRDTSQLVSSLTVGGSLSAAAPEIIVTAKEKIVLRCGSSSITISADAIEIKARKFDLADSKLLKVVTGRVDHN